MKRTLLKIAFSLTVGLLLLEGLCSALAWLQFRTLDVGKLNEFETGNTYIADKRDEYTATLKPHPYLGWTQGENNVGLFGPDFPYKRDPNYFTILLTGGSVADQLCRYGELDKVIKSPNGKPVRVLHAAVGAWCQPQQTIVLSLYGDACDAVVTVDGFNELHRLMGNAPRLERPGSNFLGLNPILEGGFDRLGASWQCKKLRQLAQRSHSRAVYYIAKAIRVKLEADLPRSTQRDFFEFPNDWTPAERAAFNLAEYQKYLRLMHATSAELGIKEAHFIQPCPAIGKRLTPDEQAVVGELDYADVYQRMTDALLSLNDRGNAVVSLLDVFDTVSESIYADTIHCGVDGPGYRMMGKRMAADLERLWNR